MARPASLGQHDEVSYQSQMGAFVQNFKLLVSHGVDQLGMRQQQRQQALGQRGHGAAALVATDAVVAAAAAPLAFAFPIALLALPIDRKSTRLNSSHV